MNRGTAMAGRRKHLGLVTVAVAVLATGCPWDDPPPPSTSTEPTTTTSVLPDAGCNEAFPSRLTVTTATAAEIPYLKSIVACSRDAQDSTLLINKSDVVWTI